MTETLEQVLDNERAEAAILRKHGHAHDADIVARICDRVAAAAEEYLRFIPEPDARLRTNKSRDWLRSKYADWAAQGHAKKVGNMRYYRMIVLPPRANLSAAREEGRRAGAA